MLNWVTERSNEHKLPYYRITVPQRNGEFYNLYYRHDSDLCYNVRETYESNCYVIG